MTHDYEITRRQMVEEQIKTRNIKSVSVLDAMCNVPRHLFVPNDLISYAYHDTPLPIGSGQTISQPYIVAYMTDQIGPYPGMKILEIGTGSGYQAAILAYLGCEVYTIELLGELAEKAKKTFAALNLSNIHSMQANGYLGWPKEAPFDAIIVTAAPYAIPETLTEQLCEGGKMIIPVGEIYSVQSLKQVSKENGKIVVKDLLPVRFVPMVEKTQENRPHV